MTTAQLELRIDMLEAERDQLQQELTSVNDEFFKQKEYIRTCKQIIKALRPQEKLDDNGELQPLSQDAVAQNFQSQQELLQKLSTKQQTVIEQQITQETELRSIVEQLESIQHEATDLRFEANKNDPEIIQKVAECKFYIAEYQKQLREFGKNTEFDQQRAKYEQIITNQRQMIQKLQKKSLADHRRVQELDHQIMERDNQLREFKLKLAIIDKKLQQQDFNQQALLEGLNSYERAFYQNQLNSNGKISGQSGQTIKAQINGLDDQIQQQEQQIADLEQLVLTLSTQLAQLSNKQTADLTDLQIQFKKLYGEVQGRNIAAEQTIQINDQKLQMLEQKLSTLFEILQEISQNQLQQLKFERANSDVLRDVVNEMDKQLQVMKEKPLFEKSMDIIEQHVNQYKSQQSELLNRLQDSETQLNRVRGELLQQMRDINDLQRQSKQQEAELNGKLQGLKEAVGAAEAHV